MITIELKDDAVTGALSGLESLLDDLSPVMNEIGAYLVRTTRDRIRDGVTPDGSAFAPRSPATLAIYAARKQSHGDKPLNKSGDMRTTSLHHDFGRDFTQVGSSAIQAAVMQFGAVKGSLGAYFYTGRGGGHVDGASPWGTIPARPYLGLSDTDRTGILDIIGEWLDRAASGGD